MNTPPSQLGAVRTRPGRRLSMRQVLDFQQIAHEAALGLREDFRSTQDREERARVALAIASLGKSWVSLQDAKREVLGRPKAGVLKPEHRKSKRTRQTNPVVDVERVLKSLGSGAAGGE